MQACSAAHREASNCNNDTRPAVSIVMATYNRPSVLAFAIESVLAQEFADWELIVVGDACADETAALVS